MIGHSLGPMQVLLYILSLYLKDSWFKARQVIPWRPSPFSVCSFPISSNLESTVDSKVQREITVLNLNGISQLVLVMINCRTLEAVYFLKWGMQSFYKPLLRVLENLCSLFDSTQAAELVTLYSSFTPGEMACFSDSFTCIMCLWLLRSHLKCFSVLQSMQQHGTTIHLSY
jgi:hypothetical protein